MSNINKPSEQEGSRSPSKRHVSRRRVLQATGATFAAAGLAGCTGDVGPNGGQNTTSKTGGGTKEVTVITGEADPQSKKLFRDATSKFESETGITVNYQFTSWTNLQQSLAKKIRGGNPPELQQGTPADAAALWSAGILAPLTDVINELNILDDIVFQIDGEKWMIPYAQKLYNETIRADLVEEVGGTVPGDIDGRMNVKWDTFADWVTKIDKQTDYRGTILTPARNSRGTIEGLTWLWSNGVRCWRGEPGSIEVTLDQGQDRERAIEALDYVNQLHEHAPPGANFGWSDASQAYANGTGATVMYSTGRILGTLDDINPDWQSEDYTVPIQVPYQHLRDDGVRSWNSSSGYALINEAKNKDAAKEYIRWFWQSDYFIDFLHTVPLHLSPPSLDMFESERYQSHELIQRRIDVLEFQKRMLEEQQTLSPAFTADNHQNNIAGGKAYSEGTLGYLLSLVTIQNMDPGQAIDEVAKKMRSQLPE